MEKSLKRYLKGGAFTNISPKRSSNMSAIRNKNNKTTELKLRMCLVRASVKGWQMNVKGILGQPDIYFDKQKLAIFIDGCFWHGCPKCGHIPKTRKSFWSAKFRSNRLRDKKVNCYLMKSGIQVFRIWEHQLLGSKNIVAVIKKIMGVL